MKIMARHCMVLALIINLASCGTLLYPERIGQISGEIDGKVAVMNGIGLLFFIVPGVIGFAVDIYNGTIYLPSHSSHGKHSSAGHVKVISTNRHIDADYLEAVIKQEYGFSVNLNAATTLKEKDRAMDDIRLL